MRPQEPDVANEAHLDRLVSPEELERLTVSEGYVGEA